MASTTTICLQLRRNSLIKNPNSIQFFSSSSSSFPQPPPPPPPNDNDETTPSPPSQSQSQPSFSSYFRDLKSSLKQPPQQTQQPRTPFQQTQQPFQQPQSPLQRPQQPQFPFQQTQQPFQQTQSPLQRPQQTQQPRFPFQQTQQPFQQTQSPLQRPQQKNPPTKAASFDEIRKNLSEFRSRSAAPPPPGLQDSPFPSPSRASDISFQELYNRNVASRGDSSSNANSMGKGGGKMSYEVIRESLMQLKKNRPVEVNKGNDTGNRSKLTDSLFGPARSTPVYGGTGLLPASLSGKEGNKKKQGESGEMKTKFLRMYTYSDLGERLKMLRPEEAKEKKGKWFSLKELSQRLIKLRDVEEEESAADPKAFTGIRESLQKLSAYEDDKKKKSTVHRIDILGNLGGTPNYMLSPPKENLVEKYFHPDNMSSAEKMKIELKRVRDEFKMSESDCGSSRVQVAQLTTKIKHLSSTLHKKDKHSRKGLQAMVQQRKKLLKYLRRTDWDSYCFLLDKLGLRDNPDYKN